MNALTADRIAGALKTRWAGRGAVLCAETLPSTNTVLKELARQGAPHGSLAVCDHQTAGKGRIGRSWETPPGQALTFSVLLRPALKPEQAQLCTLAAALAVTDTIRECCPGLAPLIKWPNDVVIGQGKCCGVLSEVGLAEGRVAYVITGVGLNVNQLSFPEELRHRAVSLLELLRRNDPAAAPLSRCGLLACFLGHMERYVEKLEAGGFESIRAAYEAASATIGQQVQVLAPGESYTGLAKAVDGDGALLVQRQDGTLCRVLCGDVSVRGLMGYV